MCVAYMSQVAFSMIAPLLTGLHTFFVLRFLHQAIGDACATKKF